METYYLHTLSLGHNNLTQLPWIVFCSKRLKFMNIAWNRFQTLPDLVSMSIMTSFKKKELLTVGYNPFNCSCGVLWVKKWQHECKQKGPICVIDLYPNEPNCDSGPFQGRIWRSVSLEEFTVYCSFTTAG